MTTHTRLGLLVACPVALILSSLSCSKDEDMAETEFCPEYARTECATVGERCVAATNEACIATRTTACEQRAAAWKAGGRPFSGKNAAACLEKLKSTYALSTINAENLRALDDTCSRVYPGTAPANSACTVDHDCAGSLICDKMLCGARKVVAAGAGCANVGEQCPAGQICKLGPQSLRLCQARQAAGMPCSASEPCLESLRCDGTSCVARLKTSEACTQDGDCESSYCDPYRMICAPGLAFALGSDSCRAFMSGTAAAP